MLNGSVRKQLAGLGVELQLAHETLVLDDELEVAVAAREGLLVAVVELLDAVPERVHHDFEPGVHRRDVVVFDRRADEVGEAVPLVGSF